jgi:hypothetical protein
MTCQRWCEVYLIYLLLCGSCFMQLDESLVAYALQISGNMALPTILCCVAIIFVMSLIPVGTSET